MTELQKELSEVFAVISAIPVKGDSVEMMAAAREQLRKAYQMACAERETDNGG